MPTKLSYKPKQSRSFLKVCMTLYRTPGVKGLIFSKPPENYPIRSNHQRCSVKKVLLKIWQISEETPVLESLFNRVAGLKACNFIKKRLQHRRFPAKSAEFVRTPISKNICERLLLSQATSSFGYFKAVATDASL